MRTEGFRNFARTIKILALAIFFCQPLWAQRTLMLPLETGGFDRAPITFMRPHYIIHTKWDPTPPGLPVGAFSPSQMRHAYGFDQLSNQGSGQIIGIVDAYDDTNAEADLAVFDQQFGLPACTTGNGCFRKVYESGRRPAANSNWAIETALDVEWAHAIAPQATILLVEASSNGLSDLLASVSAAVRDGASVVSMSWTVAEFSGERSQDNHFVSNGVTFLAATGDAGTGVVYPAASPDVIGVGGTTLSLDANGNYLNEAAWSDSGGGLSAYEHEPVFQAQFAIPDNSSGLRGAPDVSYHADPATGYAIYDSMGINGSGGWLQVGGTSAGTPQWAALIAIANSMRAAAHKARLNGTNTSLYSLAKSDMATNFHAVTQGTNGNCGTVCDAMAGYDYITGLGTPQAKKIVSALAAQN
jgi:subtilase family serine protease